ncbi:MAG: hypothetical protein HY787_11825 [Deltaproteobacteria bacterium]|nr:hypothetical protein [Deltaproteobacteria bacterium]
MNCLIPVLRPKSADFKNYDSPGKSKVKKFLELNKFITLSLYEKNYRTGLTRFTCSLLSLRKTLSNINPLPAETKPFTAGRFGLCLSSGKAQKSS